MVVLVLTNFFLYSFFIGFCFLPVLSLFGGFLFGDFYPEIVR